MEEEKVDRCRDKMRKCRRRRKRNEPKFHGEKNGGIGEFTTSEVSGVSIFEKPSSLFALRDRECFFFCFLYSFSLRHFSAYFYCINKCIRNFWKIQGKARDSSSCKNVIYFVSLNFAIYFFWIHILLLREIMKKELKKREIINSFNDLLSYHPFFTCLLWR